MIPRREKAIFWDGSKQLSGTLELDESELRFKFEDFKHSHLNLQIQFSDIEYAKVFQLFEIATKGLKVVSKGEVVDMFILDNCKGFCNDLNAQIEKFPKKNKSQKTK